MRKYAFKCIDKETEMFKIFARKYISLSLNFTIILARQHFPLGKEKIFTGFSRNEIYRTRI
jgi:hypothetical protein